MIIFSCLSDECMPLNSKYPSDFTTRKTEQLAIAVIHPRCYKGMN